MLTPPDTRPRRAPSGRELPFLAAILHVWPVSPFSSSFSFPLRRHLPNGGGRVWVSLDFCLFKPRKGRPRAVRSAARGRPFGNGKRGRARSPPCLPRLLGNGVVGRRGGDAVKARRDCRKIIKKNPTTPPTHPGENVVKRPGPATRTYMPRPPAAASPSCSMRGPGRAVGLSSSSFSSSFFYYGPENS